MADLLQGITAETIEYTLASNAVYRGGPHKNFWIKYGNDLQPYSAVLTLASRNPRGYVPGPDILNGKKLWRDRIAAMGFHIIYRDPAFAPEPQNYWIGASFLGPPDKQADQFDKFLKKDYWETDHDPSTTEGAGIFALLREVRVNDRFAIRYLDKKGNKITIAAIGTVSDISEAGTGKLKIVWDNGAPVIKAAKPRGTGAGNWWKTLFRLKRQEDISLVFHIGIAGERVSRITWNELDWVMPSGVIGKSKSPTLHEAQYGYGGEEWLFDTSRIIEGYHYSFLEPINKEHQAFEGRTYHIHLYTIDAVSKARYWIGLIRNAEVLTREQATKVKQIYQQKGWLLQMKQQIEDVEGNASGFMSKKPLDLFNLRFKPTDLVRDGYPVKISEDNAITTYNRYAFTNFKPDMIVAEAITPPGGFTFVATGEITEDDLVDLPAKPRAAPLKPVENSYLHRKMSLKLTKRLKKTYGVGNVTREHSAGFGGKLIDIVRVDNDGANIFYELKTYSDLVASLREAIGQLMEYAVWTDLLRAKEWIIVTHLPLTELAANYLRHIRETYGLPVNYQQYVHETDQLSKPLNF